MQYQVHGSSFRRIFHHKHQSKCRFSNNSKTVFFLFQTDFLLKIYFHCQIINRLVIQLLFLARKRGQNTISTYDNVTTDKI